MLRGWHYSVVGKLPPTTSALWSFGEWTSKWTTSLSLSAFEINKCLFLFKEYISGHCLVFFSCIVFRGMKGRGYSVILYMFKYQN